MIELRQIISLLDKAEKVHFNVNINSSQYLTWFWFYFLEFCSEPPFLAVFILETFGE